MTIDSLHPFFQYLFICMGTSVVLGLALLVIAVLQLRKLNIPPDADFTETLQYTPLLVVVALDLLDLGLDVLAAPFAWVILGWLGLKSLRNVATVEALIPLTGPIPTLTLAWLAVRFGFHF